MVDGGPTGPLGAPAVRRLESGAAVVSDLVLVALTCAAFLLLALLARGVAKL
jgi:hypothetical protein